MKNWIHAVVMKFSNFLSQVMAENELAVERGLSIQNY